MRDVKLVFAINHTMPYTEEYDNLVKELFAGKIGEGSRVLPPLNLVCADQVTLGKNVLVIGGSLMMSRRRDHLQQCTCRPQSRLPSH